MVCPNCGKEVAGTDGVCGSCGRSLTSPKLSTGESVPSAGVAAPPTENAGHGSGISWNAIGSLVLGLLPFVLFVPVFSLMDAYYRASGIRFWGYFGLMPVATVLAIVFGRRVKAANPQGELRSALEIMAVLGRTLGYIGLVCFILFMAVALYLPHFVTSSRRDANQGSARRSLREINAAAATYATTFGHGFPATLAALGPTKSDNPSANAKPSEQAAGLIDDNLAAGMKSNFRFHYAAGTPASQDAIRTYAVHADPMDSEYAGTTHYFTDQTGVIRQEDGKEADEHSPPIK